MMRFACQANHDPRDLHCAFLRAGAKPSLYTCYPRRNKWTLATVDHDEAAAIRRALDRLGIEFDEKVSLRNQKDGRFPRLSLGVLSASVRRYLP
jgi:hypothetical protein